jgi:hypothetical protein
MSGGDPPQADGKTMFKRAVSFLSASLLYVVFAVYLFWPHLKKNGYEGYIFTFSAAAASVGCLLLSRRWVANFLGSFFAGALYGFGPFMLGLAKFHPSASLLAAAVPWLFLPTAFAPAGKKRFFKVAIPVLSGLPYLAIIIFFQLASHYRLFAVPIEASIQPADLTGFIWPLAAAESGGGGNPIGLYHIANAILFIGLVMMIKARRYKVMAILAAGAILAFCPPVWQVSPVMWFSIPSVVIAILAGAGFDGLVLTGYSDRRWVLAAIFLSGLFSMTAFLFAAGYFQAAVISAEFKTLFAFSARFHLLAALVLLVIYFLLRSQIRLTLVRRLLISAALAIDIFFAARYIVDSVM